MDSQSDLLASLTTRFSSLFAEFSNPKSLSAPNVNFSSEPTSRASWDESAHYRNDMRLARTRPPSPRYTLPQTNKKSMPFPYSNRPVHTSRAASISGPSTSSQSLPQSHKRDSSHPVLPVLRWLSGEHRASRSSSASSSKATTPTHSNPPSPSAVSALSDALHDDPILIEVRSPTSVDLPCLPEAARLHPSSHTSRPPNFLTSLTRSTLPTASLSPPPSYTAFRNNYTDPFDDPFTRTEYNEDLDLLYSPTPEPLAMPHTPAPAHLTRSPPTLSMSRGRSSIDSLRSIQERGSRGLHTTPPQRLTLPTLPVIRSWFTSEDALVGKENMDPFLDEQDRAKDPQVQRKHIQERYASPKNPVVFCHGLLGFDTVTVGPSLAPIQVSHWRGIKDALEANGVEVLITRVPATSSPIDRAKVLEEKISAAYPGRSVHLIGISPNLGHSMGGLDCRYLTTHLKTRKFKVLSITTIATPHRGSSFADHFLNTVGPERMPSILSLLDMLPNGGGDGKAFEFLTVENMRKFNEDTPDVPGVKYFSWGAVYNPGLIDTWKWPHSVIMDKEGPNDGLVSMESAKWGTYLGTLEDVNHLDLVGWVNTARYKWAEIMGREIKFKPATFYLSVADNIARAVEGQEPHRLREEVDQVDEEILEETERAQMAESLAKGGPGRESRGGQIGRRKDTGQEGAVSAKRKASAGLDSDVPSLRL